MRFYGFGLLSFPNDFVERTTMHGVIDLSLETCDRIGK